MNRMLSLLLVLGISLTAAAQGTIYQYPGWEDMAYPKFQFPDDGGNTVIIIMGDSDPMYWEYDMPFGHRTMRELWNSIYSEDASFTVRAGDEYLIYSQNTLVYTRGDIRSSVMIFPEELWVIMNHCCRSLSPAMGEVSMQAWFPGMDEPLTTFFTIHDPAMSVIQGLLQRGREAA